MTKRTTLEPIRNAIGQRIASRERRGVRSAETYAGAKCRYGHCERYVKCGRCAVCRRLRARGEQPQEIATARVTARAIVRARM